MIIAMLAVSTLWLAWRSDRPALLGAPGYASLGKMPFPLQILYRHDPALSITLASNTRKQPQEIMSEMMPGDQVSRSLKSVKKPPRSPRPSKSRDSSQAFARGARINLTCYLYCICL